MVELRKRVAHILISILHSRDLVEGECEALPLGTVSVSRPSSCRPPGVLGPAPRRLAACCGPGASPEPCASQSSRRRMKGALTGSRQHREKRGFWLHLDDEPSLFPIETNAACCPHVTVIWDKEFAQSFQGPCQMCTDPRPGEAAAPGPMSTRSSWGRRGGLGRAHGNLSRGCVHPAFRVVE